MNLHRITSCLNLLIFQYIIISVKSETSAAYRSECLRTHNKMRERHGAPILKLNDTLNQAAEEWAKTIADEALAHGVEVALRWKRVWNIGENIGGHEGSSDGKIKNVFKDGGWSPRVWYREIMDHNFDVLKFNGRTGHFTQIIWLETTDLGVAMVETTKGQIIIVCFYFPAGNWDYQISFGKNVLKPKTGETNIIPDDPDFQKFLE